MPPNRLVEKALNVKESADFVRFQSCWVALSFLHLPANSAVVQHYDPRVQTMPLHVGQHCLYGEF